MKIKMHYSGFLNNMIFANKFLQTIFFENHTIYFQNVNNNNQNSNNNLNDNDNTNKNTNTGRRRRSEEEIVSKEDIYSKIFAHQNKMGNEFQKMKEDIANINNLIDKPKNELELARQVMNTFITDVIGYYFS